MKLRRIFCKKPTLKFSCAINGIVELYPIVKASQIEKKWLSKSNTAKRCPSISRIIRTGWVQVAWQDIHIKTDDNDFMWETPISQDILSDHLSISNYVDWHRDEYHEITEDVDVLEKVVKIQAPWMCRIPEGYSLLQTDWRFGDYKPYTAVTGLTRGDKDVAHLSVHLKVKKNAEFTIKAGQPLCHYFLVENKQADFVVETASQEDLNSYQKVFIKNRNSFKENKSET